MLSPDVEYRDRAAFFSDTKTLVLADLHVGKDDASMVSFPLGERGDLHDRLENLLSFFDPSTVVFAGDVLHEFHRVTERSETYLQALTDTCREAGARPVLVRGNHDTQLASAWDGDISEEFRAGGVLVCHGHTEPEGYAECYVIGHDHPAIEIEGRKRPCYLVGDGVYRGGNLLVLPAFNRLVAGVRINDLRTSDFQSPLVTDADLLNPLVYDADVQETLEFPPLGEFRAML